MLSATHSRVNQGIPLVERKLRRLSLQKQQWASASPAIKLQYLNGIADQIKGLDHEQWARDMVYARGYNPNSASASLLIAEQALENSKVLVGTVRRLQRSYKALVKNGTLPFLDTKRGKDHVILKSFPEDLYDRFSREGQAGIESEIHLGPGINQTKRPKAARYGKLCLVLGSGSQSFVSFRSVMHQLFIKGDVCFLKHHRLRSICVPYYTAIFSELIKDGFVATAIGDNELGQSLVHHGLVDRVHLTGHRHSQEAIIWGPDEETRHANRSNFQPKLRKPLSSSLGSVVPWLIPSGLTWSKEEIEHGANLLVSAFTNQSGPQCAKPQVVIVDQNWPQRLDFFNAVRRLLRISPLQPAYYPNTLIRYQQILGQYSSGELEVIKSLPSDAVPTHKLGNCLPWLLIKMDNGSSNYAIKNHISAPILAFYSLNASNNARMYFDKAVDFANNSISGSTSCTILAPRQMEKDNQRSLEDAIHRLRFGTIGINTTGATLYTMSGVTWGAYPGELVTDPVSGIGQLNNGHFLEGINKSVVRAPFKNSAQRTIITSASYPSYEKRLRTLQDVILKPSLSGLMKLAYQRTMT